MASLVNYPWLQLDRLNCWFGNLPSESEYSAFVWYQSSVVWLALGSLAVPKFLDMDSHNTPSCLRMIFNPESFFPLNLSICPCLSVGQRWRGILIYIVKHQHFGCPGSIEVWQHLGQPVRVNRLADMTSPAPVIELLAICRPWLSCCHIIINLGVAVVHHI